MIRSTPRRIRYLQPHDWPLLLRLKDVDPADEQCQAALATYACMERKGVRPPGYRCADDQGATTASPEGVSYLIVFVTVIS